ncbi:MAG TPA: hypothetical protein VLS27_17570 [Gammaproteobacteria bacterium]|nr:hypothetical protein [Gammaproteobacteria bacterium]
MARNHKQQELNGIIDRDAVSRLEHEARALASALAEFEHEARRVRDQLERRGGRGFALEDRLERLQQNITATQRDLQRVRKRIASEGGEAGQGERCPGSRGTSFENRRR